MTGARYQNPVANESVLDDDNTYCIALAQVTMDLTNWVLQGCSS